MKEFPVVFLERLRLILPASHYESVVKTFSESTSFSGRINTLKTSEEEVLKSLEVLSVDLSCAEWYPQGLVFSASEREKILKSDLVSNGMFYPQSLSSMLPVVVLDPQPGEQILDMCAAPGSKTTQMAALMQNNGKIISVENIKNRQYRLRSVVKLLGADIVEFKLMDGRRFKAYGGLFDKVLVDAPCSSEGRFKTFEKKSYAYWSLRKIREMVRKQRGLLLNASRALKPGGTLVYSTCTFAPEENEGIVSWFLRKTEGAFEVVPVSFKGIDSYPAIQVWNEREYNPQVKNCFRVLPTEKMEGFFVAKMVKKG